MSAHDILTTDGGHYCTRCGEFTTENLPELPCNPPTACQECGRSARACGRSSGYCCSACGSSRFATHYRDEWRP